MERIDNDNYATPDDYASVGVAKAIEAFDKKRRGNLTFLEPGCGDIQPHMGFFKDFFPGAKMLGIDIRNVEPKQGEEVVSDLDFLQMSRQDLPALIGADGVDIIVTNPPYKFAREFILRSLALLNPGGVAGFLLKLDFLGSRGRVSFFQDTPLYEVCVSGGRPSFTCGTTDMHNYGYFLWKNGHLGDPKISWFTV